MPIRLKILGIYLLILLLGVGISGQIYLSGQAIDTTSRHLLEKNVPLLAHISTIKSAMIEHERIYYEYYATTDQGMMLKDHQVSHDQLSDALDALNQSLGQTQELMYASQMIAEVHRVADELDEVLASNRIDWDHSREKLVTLSEFGRSLIPHLDQLQQKLQSKVISTADLVHENTAWTSNMVLAFSLLMVIVAAIIAFYLDKYIHSSLERKRLAMYPERNPNPVITIHSDGEVSYVNPAFQTLLSKVCGDNTEDYWAVLPEDILSQLKALYKSAQQELDIDYAVADLILSCHIHWLKDLEVCHIHLKDVTDEYKAKEKLEFTAYHDALTELPNRQQLDKLLNQCIERDEQNVAVAIIKLDRFNLITSGHGFSVGDDIIKALAKRLTATKSLVGYDNCQLFRFDGARFAIIIPEQKLQGFIADLNKQLETPLFINDAEFYVTLSVGYSVYPHDERHVTALIQNADAAVIRVYANGGNACQRFTEDLRQQEQSWLAIETELRHALDDEELVLFYQPQICASSQNVIGMEALLRWQSKARGMVPPFEFIPVAEQTGLIVKVGEWVIKTACRQAKAWQDEYKSNYVVAINISPKQFLHPDFLTVVTRAIEETKVDPQLIEFEITEGVMVENTERCIAILQALKKIGILLSIDDFGTGYSSMAYLKRFSIDKLKIDQVFVKNLPDDQKDLAIVRSIIDLSHNLDLKVIAEGVETEAQRDLLQEQGCDEFQGYYFSKPKPVSELADLLSYTPSSALI